MKEAIRLENISFGYSKEKKALKNLNLVINAGETVSILGKNGSGKSTLGLLLCGINLGYEGKYFLNETLIEDKTSNLIKNNVGIIFQNPDNQFIANSVEEDIAFGLENRNMTQQEMKAKVLEFATKVGMQEFLKKEPSNLSGGQKQRVALAAMLALNLNILILDEATSMLDLKAKEDIFELIREIKKQNPNMTILNITHDVEEAKYSDKVLVMENGELSYFDETEKLFSNDELIKKFNLNEPFSYKLKRILGSSTIKFNPKKTLKEISEEIYDSLK